MGRNRQWRMGPNRRALLNRHRHRPTPRPSTIQLNRADLTRPNTPHAAATTPPSRRTRPELARSRPSDTPEVNPPPSKAFSRKIRANGSELP